MTVVGGEKELHSARKAAWGLYWLHGSLPHPTELPLPPAYSLQKSPTDWAVGFLFPN